MVLQERIELSTSFLPRRYSTTELLQHLDIDGGNDVLVAVDRIELSTYGL